MYKYAVSDTVDRRVEELRAVSGPPLDPSFCASCPSSERLALIRQKGFDSQSQNTSLFLASDGGVNAAKESRMVQQTERASAAARKVAKTDELIDDEASRPSPFSRVGRIVKLTYHVLRSSRTRLRKSCSLRRRSRTSNARFSPPVSAPKKEARHRVQLQL